ncbi:MAG TPA: hypothetical protein VFA74_09900 [Terriglobales bacterium]|nr:hypothetical protein [Terriglobales bacterium]
MSRAELTTTNAGAPSVPMSGIWRTIRDYILWSYDRGTIQYDVMVTLILIFVFFSPYWINFKDKPVPHRPHPSEVVVVPDGDGGLIYQVESSAVTGHDDGGVRDDLLRVIEPISGEVRIQRYELVHDRFGRVLSYKVWVRRD